MAFRSRDRRSSSSSYSRRHSTYGSSRKKTRYDNSNSRSRSRDLKRAAIEKNEKSEKSKSTGRASRFSSNFTTIPTAQNADTNKNKDRSDSSVIKPITHTLQNGQALQSTVYPRDGQIAMIHESMNPNLKPAREVYVGNLPVGTEIQHIIEFFNMALSIVKGVCFAGNPCMKAWLSPDGHFAFLEHRTMQEAANTLQLNGISFNGQILRIGKPKTFVPELAAIVPNPTIPEYPSNVLAGGLDTLGIAVKEYSEREKNRSDPSADASPSQLSDLQLNLKTIDLKKNQIYVATDTNAALLAAQKAATFVIAGENSASIAGSHIDNIVVIFGTASNFNEPYIKTLLGSIAPLRTFEIVYLHNSPLHNTKKSDKTDGAEKGDKYSNSVKDDKYSNSVKDDKYSNSVKDDKDSNSVKDDKYSNSVKDDKDSNNRENDKDSKNTENDKDSNNRENDKDSKNTENDKDSNNRENDKDSNNRENDKDSNSVKDGKDNIDIACVYSFETDVDLKLYKEEVEKKTGLVLNSGIDIYNSEKVSEFINAYAASSSDNFCKDILKYHFPSRCIMMRLKPDLKLITDDDYYQEIKNDAVSELSKYGKIERCYLLRPQGELVPPEGDDEKEPIFFTNEGYTNDESSVGMLFAQFDNIYNASKCRKYLNGKKFDGSFVQISYFNESKFQQPDFRNSRPNFTYYL